MRTLYRENKKYCGDYLDVQIYPVYKKSTHRKIRAKPTTDIQKRLNADNAARKLVQILHTNFTRKDFALHLTYGDDYYPSDDEGAKRDVQNFIRRAKRLYAKAGITNVKYVWVTEKGKTRGRIHHHLVISGGIDRTELEALWGKGYANTKSLQFTKNGLAGLGNYIIKEPMYYKRWSASRNLKKPIERTNDYRFTRRKAKELSSPQNFEYNAVFEKLYPDYFFSESVSTENKVNGGIYITIRLYKKTAKIL